MKRKAYRSDSVRRRQITSKSKGEVQPFVAQFPAQAEVPDHYDQTDPSRSYLMGGFGFVDYVIIVSPLVFGFLMGLMFLEFSRIRNRMKRAQRRARQLQLSM